MVKSNVISAGLGQRLARGSSLNSTLLQDAPDSFQQIPSNVALVLSPAATAFARNVGNGKGTFGAAIIPNQVAREPPD
jgi:hypothetical protein